MSSRDYKDHLAMRKIKYPLYTVYKILVTGSTYSYIGVTKDYRRRRDDHWNAIRSIIVAIQAKSDNISYTSFAHLVIAHFLYNKNNRKGYVSSTAGLNISVIKEFRCPIKAKETETEYISRYSRWGKNLNTAKKSAYTIVSKDPNKPKRKTQSRACKTISHTKIKKSCYKKSM